MSELIEIMNFDRGELAADVQSRLQLEPFRANQLAQWLYRRRFTDFAAMTNISKGVRAQLSETYRIFRPRPLTVQQSADGTRKYLFRLEDESAVETVLIKQPTRYTLCVSSQVGCAIGCRFCRTARMGLKRHLQTREIIGQVLAVQDDIAQLQTSRLHSAESESDDVQNTRAVAQTPDFFQNIVFMGMGEPLHNFQNVTRAVRILNDGLGFNFSGRKITVSTSGLVPALEKLPTSGAEMNLAVSLNATTDEVRSHLIPINKRWPLEVLLGALRRYPLTGRRRITFEYVMLRDVNDTKADLERLPELIRGIPAKVNLIPYNQNAGLGFNAPLRENVARWQETLLQNGINATIRWSKGEDISAACGQLATENLN